MKDAQAYLDKKGLNNVNLVKKLEDMDI